MVMVRGVIIDGEDVILLIKKRKNTITDLPKRICRFQTRQDNTEIQENTKP